MRIEGSIGTVFELASIPDLWLESSYNEKGWLFSGETRKGQELSLNTIWSELVPGISLPMELDVTLKDIDLKIHIGNAQENKRDYKLTFDGSIATHIKPADGFESELSIEKVHFVYEKVATNEQKTAIEFSLKANAHINDFLIVNNCNLDFNYAYNAEKQSNEWHFKGDLYVQAFGRLLYFKAEAEVLKTEQAFSFVFNTAHAAIHQTYFNKIKDTSPTEILTVLNKGTLSENKQIKLADIPADYENLLKSKFSSEQTTAIVKVVEAAKRCNEPLVSIPDILNNNKILCAVNPYLYELKLRRKENKFISLDVAIGSNFTLYNTWADQTALFSIKEGVLGTGFDIVEKQFYLSYESKNTTVKPLALVGLLPGIQETLNSAFGETPEKQPKTVALLNMFEIRPGNFKFVKKDTNYNLQASIKLVLNEQLKIVNEDLYTYFEQLFPKSGDERFIEGILSYNSKEGLLFILRNNNGLKIPNLFAKISESLDPDFKENFRQNTGITIDSAMDLGESFVILDQVRFKLAKEIQMDMRVGVGLPSNLNDRFFNPDSKIHGLINCYDRERFENAQIENDLKVFDSPLPDDGLLRATLKFGTDGISGQLEQFNVFNLEKVAEEFDGFIKETEDSVILDLNALTDDSRNEYGKLELEKIIFKLNFKKAAFDISGGFQILSDSFKIPVAPIAKKLINLLPPDTIDTKILNAVADKCTDTIALKSLSFYDKETQELRIDDLLDFFRQFLLKEHQNLEIVPKELLDIINTASAEVSSFLPEKLLEYMSIDIPAGISFSLQITPDNSFCLDFEVAEPTLEQREVGFSEHLQILFPDVAFPPQGLYGFRIKKIGLGSALFSQAIRLDLSAECLFFKYADLIAGAGYELIRKSNRNDEKLQFMLPDVKEFGMEYKVEDLILFIFPQTYVPIPVPIFYEDFSCYAVGLEGSKTEFSIKFPKPNLNIKEALEAIGDLKTFFSEKEFALPISNYVNYYPNTEQGILPNFTAGPIAFELPGILGSERKADNTKQKIVLGLTEPLTFNPKDIIALFANSAKFGMLCLVEKKKIAIKIDENRSEYPLNYLIKYIPQSKRIGFKNITFLELFEGNFAWVFCTPNEFIPHGIPALLQKEAEENNSIQTLPVAATIISEMLPNANEWTSEQEGLVTAMKGRIAFGPVFKMNSVFVAAVVDTHDVYSGIFLNTQIAGLLNFSLKSNLQITPKEAHKFQLKGKANMTILDDLTVFDGSFLLGIGEKSIFKVQGMIDLFPFEESPVKLYTGTAKGAKSNITGVINEQGIVLGHLQEDGSVTAAGMQLEIGAFHMGGSTRILNTAEQGAWEINFQVQNTIMNFHAGYQKNHNGKLVQFGIDTNNPIDLDGIVKIASSSGEKGPDGKLVLQYTDGVAIPALNTFYLDASLTILGLHSFTKIAIDASQFTAKLNADLGIISYDLDVRGTNLNDLNTFNLNGSFGLLNNAIKATLQTSFLSNEQITGFKGSSTLEILEKTYVDWNITASVMEGNPEFKLQGILDVFYIPGVFRLFSGTGSGMESITGTLTKDKLHISGGLQLHFGFVELGGTTNLTLSQADGFQFKTNLKFNAGLFANFNLDLAITKSDHILALDGNSSGSVVLIPGFIELTAENKVSLRLNEKDKTVDEFKLHGRTNLLGDTIRYDILIAYNTFQFYCDINLPLIDISIAGQSSDINDFSKMRFSGTIDVKNINNEIDRLYGSLVDTVGSKINEAKEDIEQVKTEQSNCNRKINELEREKREKERKLNEIKRIYDSWKGNGSDPDFFNRCVPPVGHVDYWSKHRVPWLPWNYRYSRSDVEEVRRYYNYIKDLNLNIREPKKGDDLGRLINSIGELINNTFTTVTQEVTKAIRDVGNAVHHVFAKEILDKINVDTSGWDAINKTFNDGINAIEESRKVWTELNTKLLQNKPFEVTEITYKDQSVDLFTHKKVTATVTFKVLGDQQEPVNIELNLDNPIEGITNTIKLFIPKELRGLL
ncbi:MAG: hypothetical protein RIE52_13390 [Balneola sp.]|jgi:hypothetical protein